MSPSLVVVAEACARTGLFLGSKQRGAGLELRASATSPGRLAAARGYRLLASIIMAIIGHPAALNDLSGEGLATLRSRL